MSNKSSLNEIKSGKQTSTTKYKISGLLTQYIIDDAHANNGFEKVF
jgi:hypothetical protein